ncbi:MAG: hypothetical protein ACE5JI_02825 [Acidobacteriota bacterium]
MSERVCLGHLPGGIKLKALLASAGMAVILTGSLRGELEEPAVPDGTVLEGVVTCPSRQSMVVYVEAPGGARVSPPSKPAVLDQRKLRFVPHVLPVVVGTRVAFINSDPVLHNVFSASKTKLFNLGTYPSGVTRYVTFDRPGVVEVLCNVHHEMSAYIVVLETPYYTLTDEAGHYRLEGLPEGEHWVSVWCEVNGTRRERTELGFPAVRIDFDFTAKGGS